MKASAPAGQRANLTRAFEQPANQEAPLQQLPASLPAPSGQVGRYSADFAAILASPKDSKSPVYTSPMIRRGSTDDSRHASALFGGALACLLAVGASAFLWLAVEKGGPAPSSHKEDLATIGYVDPPRSVGTIGLNPVAVEKRNPPPSDKPSAAPPDAKTTPLAPIAGSLQAAVDAAPNQSVSPRTLGILTAALPATSSDTLREELRSTNETQRPTIETGPSAILILSQIAWPSAKPANVEQVAALPSPVLPAEPDEGQGSPSSVVSDEGGRDNSWPAYISTSINAPVSSIATASRAAPMVSSNTENNLSDSNQRVGGSVDGNDQPAAERTKTDKKARNPEAGAGKGAKGGKSGGASDSTQKGSDGAKSSKASGKSDGGTGSRNGSSSKGHSDKDKHGGATGHDAKSNDGKGNGGKGDGKGSP